MIFPPHIAPPCNFPCCRPSSSSVPRCSIGRRNSFSLSTDQRPPTPPRPPPLRHELNYNSTPNTPAGKLKQQACVYKMVPIIKPASSMPGGLSTKNHCVQLSKGINVVATRNVISHYHSSQPNLLSNSSGRNRDSVGRHDSMPIGNITSAFASHTVNTNVDGNLKADSSCPAIFGVSTKNIGRTLYTFEPRTTAYYYNELLQKPTIFGSNLNLVNESMKEEKDLSDCSNVKTSEPSTIGSTKICNGISLSPKAAVYHSQNNQNNNEVDTEYDTAVSNRGNECDKRVGYFEVSKTYEEYPSASCQFNNHGIGTKAAATQVSAQNNNFGPKPAARSFSTAIPSSDSLLKTSRSSGLYNHSINMNNYYTSNKICSNHNSCDPNKFGSSNEQMA
ncbi:uncharacterized protein LOC118747833 [Rhagoletis pomonella]|uniref:uncharacterized protein LOC118747833 n=1 Tax=Rhagoletis pomonella TaxID=28610 RepID=UPI0017875DAE|nr:uncharacterized protein LOC118747833 [Rhagoletis pomonella]